MPETQLNDPERSDDEMSIDEDLATQFPGAPVARAVSDDLNALEQLLDVVFIARDGSSARSASQRACYEAVSTRALKSFCEVLQNIGSRRKPVSS